MNATIERLKATLDHWPEGHYDALRWQATLAQGDAESAQFMADLHQGNPDDSDFVAKLRVKEARRREEAIVYSRAASEILRREVLVPHGIGL